MSAQPDQDLSDYIVFIDESGDHGLANVDPQYPMFVLALCVFRKQDYIDLVCPMVQRFKFSHWGHDSVVLHEHDIRKPGGPYGFLFNPARRAAFMHDLSALIEAAPFVTNRIGGAQERFETGIFSSCKPVSPRAGVWAGTTYPVS